VSRVEDLDRFPWQELRALVDAARAELERRESTPLDLDTAWKSLELDLKRHHRRKDEDRFNPFA